MNGIDDGRDLTPLDPSADPVRWESMVAGINRVAAGELARRAALPEPGVLLVISEWRRPAAALCAAIAAGAAAILLMRPASSGTTDAAIASALGYPEPVAAWVEAERSPSVEELLFAMEGAE